jgi:energy-coupling factor transporter ATP-binding protein EcfA2
MTIRRWDKVLLILGKTMSGKDVRMQLTAFRIFKYRNIEDSGLVKLRDQVTCIVGKNQSGKTNLLRALHKLNPHDKSVKYDSRTDWPRGGRRARDETQVVCEAHFQLDVEQAELAKLTESAITATKVIVKTDYAAQHTVEFPDQPDLFPNRVPQIEVDQICAKLAVPSAQVGEAFFQASTECIAEIKETARLGQYAEIVTLAGAHREKLERAGSAGQPECQNEAQFLSGYINLLHQISAELAALPTTRRRAEQFIIRNLPTFIYMDEHRSFEGTAHLDQVLQRLKLNELTPQDETLLMIFKLAGLDLAKLVEQGSSQDPATIRERQYDLQDAGQILTAAVADRWAQTPYKVQFRADGQRFFTEIEELDKDIGMLPLEEQSRGFRWFFSFDLRFMYDSGGTFAGCVLLLDEPGMHLHPGAQDDLLRRFDAYGQENTLIYTTHLPFLVDIRDPGRIHVMKEREDKSITVSDDLIGSGPVEKLTLQAALGMKASQQSQVAHKNLVVGGPDELFILTALSSLLERSGRSGLADDIAIVASGSPSAIVYRSAFMVGQGIQVVALFNSDDVGRAEEATLRTKWLPHYKNANSSTVLLGAALDQSGDFGIEDLFSERGYLSKAHETHAAALTRAGAKSIAPQGSGTLAARVKRGFEDVGVKFDQRAVAKLIRKELQELRRMPYLSDIGRETADKADRLFTFINGQFSS